MGSYSLALPISNFQMHSLGWKPRSEKLQLGRLLYNIALRISNLQMHSLDCKPRSERLQLGRIQSHATDFESPDALIELEAKV